MNKNSFPTQKTRTLERVARLGFEVGGATEGGQYVLQRDKFEVVCRDITEVERFLDGYVFGGAA